MRKFLSLIAIVLASALLLTGCGFSSWQDEETAKNIKEIKRVSDNDGKVYLEVSYTDGSDSDRFLIPEGVSIVGATADYSSTERKTTVTIKYSDGTKPFVFDIPDGVDGAAVNNVAVIEKNGIRYLSFQYVDAEGNELQSWDININEFRGDDGATWLFGEGNPNGEAENEETGEKGKEAVKGKQGDFYLDTSDYVVYNLKADGSWQKMGSIKGTGISSIRPFTDDKSTMGGYEIVTTDILLDEAGNPVLDDDNKPKYVSYKVYSSAVNKMSVNYNKETGMYEFVLTVTDVLGNPIELGAGDDKISVQRPAAWFSGALPPDFITEITFDGDFYYCTTYNEIYTKKGGVWVSLVNLKSEEEKMCDITFMPEGGEMIKDVNLYPGTTAFKADGSVVVSLKKGSCYPVETVNIPVPTKEGYEFLGWYKKKDATINNGIFTDMVPVYENITLYARWQEKPATEG